MLAGLPTSDDPNILVQLDTADDAGVVKVSDDLALIQTVDFFTPVVDDAQTYGQIAAANSLSDVYAMGGTPISALNIVCWTEDLPQETLHAILKGGMEKALEAGCPVVGGHSVTAPELKYGLSVTGQVHPDKIVSNAGARPGDVLVLTKSVGTGIITTALKFDNASEAHESAVVSSMAHLNRNACDSMCQNSANGCTDITGNGLLGHAWELASASGVHLEIEASSVPLFDGTVELAKKGNLTLGDRTNRKYVEGAVTIDRSVDDALQSALFDPQTSGGLLISIPEANVDDLAAQLIAGGDLAHVVGRVADGAPGTIGVLE